jgi:hypothetical protein
MIRICARNAVGVQRRGRLARAFRARRPYVNAIHDYVMELMRREATFKHAGRTLTEWGSADIAQLVDALGGRWREWW